MVDISYLNLLRRSEMEDVLPLLPVGGRVLEFGSGTGEQARFLSERGFDVVALDLATSNYAHERIFPVTDYDGSHIPLEDQSIDAIFSSNVLEHVENLEQISAEFLRILKPRGIAVHVLPTAGWRFWSFATGAADSVKAAATLPFKLARNPSGDSRGRLLIRELRHVASGFVPRAHGTSWEGLSELWTFSRAAWRRKFRQYGFEVIHDRPVGFFYTGTVLFGHALTMEKRRRLGRVLGSATQVYLVKPASTP